MKDFGLLFLSILFFSSLISCELEDEDKSGKPKPGYLNKMPEETSIGANTFGCYVNGELRASQGKYQEEGVEPYLWSASYVNGFWEKYENDTCMNLDIVTKDAVYYLNIYNTPFVGINSCYFHIVSNDNSNLSGSTNSVIEIVKFDKMDRIISGYFDSVIISAQYLDWSTNQYIDSVVHITKGQFDIKYGQNY